MPMQPSPTAETVSWVPSLRVFIAAPLSARAPSPPFRLSFVIVGTPCGLAGIAGDLVVEDAKAGRQACEADTHLFAVPLQQLAAPRFRARALFPQGRIAHHVPDRHPGRLQPTEKLDPGQDRRVV